MSNGKIYLFPNHQVPCLDIQFQRITCILQFQNEKSNQVHYGKHFFDSSPGGQMLCCMNSQYYSQLK